MKKSRQLGTPPRRRGRPRTHGGEAEVRVRLTSEQREALGRAVRASGKTIQDWMVEAIAEKIARE